MDAKAAIAAIPVLRGAWRILPGPLRIPLLVIGGVAWLWRRRRGDEHPDERAP